MIDYSRVKVGDKLLVTGMGAPGFAELGDVVTVTDVRNNRVDVTHDTHGTSAYFALTSGAERLDYVREKQTIEAADVGSVDELFK